MNDVTVCINWNEENCEWEWRVDIPKGKGYRPFEISGDFSTDSVADAIRDATNALDSLGVGIKKIEVLG